MQFRHDAVKMGIVVTPAANVDPERATLLLLAVAAAPDDQKVAAAFDDCLYPVVLASVRKRNQYFASAAARAPEQAQPWVPQVSEADLDHMVHSTAVLALQRARRSAGRFDPEKGDAIAWVLRNAQFAWIEEARKAAPNPRRHGIPTADDELAAEGHRSGGCDVADQAATAVDLNDCLNRLPPEEQQAVMLCLHLGFSHREAAEMMMGDRERHKRVDKLLQQARTRLNQMWEEG